MKYFYRTKPILVHLAVLLLILAFGLAAVAVASLKLSRNRLKFLREEQIDRHQFDMRRDFADLKLSWNEQAQQGLLVCWTDGQLELKVDLSNWSRYMVESSLEQRPTRKAVNIGYRIISIRNRRLAPTFGKIAFNRPLRPKLEGMTADYHNLNLIVLCPVESGEYLVEIDLVQEDVGWLKRWSGNAPLLAKIHVR